MPKYYDQDGTLGDVGWMNCIIIEESTHIKKFQKCQNTFHLRTDVSVDAMLIFSTILVDFVKSDTYQILLVGTICKN